MKNKHLNIYEYFNNTVASKQNLENNTNSIPHTPRFCDLKTQPGDDHGSQQYINNSYNGIEQHINNKNSMEKKRNVKKAVIIGLAIIGIISVIITAVFAVFYFIGKNAAEKELAEFEEELQEEQTPYSKGEYFVDTHKYINEWANLEITFPDGWEEQDTSVLKNENTEVGLYVKNKKKDSIMISFIKNTSGEFFSASEYLEHVVKGMRESTTISDESESESAFLNGFNMYDRKTITMEKEGRKAYMALYVQQKDNQVICIYLGSADRARLAQMMDWLEEYD